MYVCMLHVCVCVGVTTYIKSDRMLLVKFLEVINDVFLLKQFADSGW